MAAIADITGLPDVTIQTQIEFLCLHDFIEHGVAATDTDPSGTPTKLSERGHRLLEVERLLKDEAEQFIWLDSFTQQRNMTHLLLIDPTDLLDTVGPVSATMPVRPRPYSLFDEIGRLRTLLSAEGKAGLVTLLGRFWPGADALITEERDHWEYALDRPPSDQQAEPAHWSIVFAPHALSLHPHPLQLRSTLCAVRLPVLETTLSFQRAEGLPWSITPPPSRHIALEQVSYRPIPDLPSHAAEPKSDALILPTMPLAQTPDLPTLPLPPGLCATFSARTTHRIYHLDEAEIQQQMRLQGRAHLFSPHRQPASTSASDSAPTQEAGFA